MGINESVRHVVESLPTYIRDKLISAGVEIRTGRVLTDAISDLSGNPRGWPVGTQWNEVGGMHRREQNRSLIGIGEHCIVDGVLLIRKRIDGVVRHEIGHAWDFEAAPGMILSRCERFLQAYREDVLRMGPIERSDLRSFLLPGFGGSNEAFAEAFAISVGGGSGKNDKRDNAFRVAFSNVLKFVSDTFSEGFQP